MSDLFRSVFGLAEDAVRIVASPAKMAIDLTRAVTKPMADAATEAAKTVAELTKAPGK